MALDECKHGWDYAACPGCGNADFANDVSRVRDELQAEKDAHAAALGTLGNKLEEATGRIRELEDVLLVLNQSAKHREGCSVRISPLGYGYAEIVVPCDCGVHAAMEKAHEIVKEIAARRAEEERS